MKKSTKKILFIVGATTAAIYAYNKYVELTATKKNLLSSEDGDYYIWKDYDIFYTKTGEGSPILLIHDANPSSSSEEWSKLKQRLAKTHTVYCIDLLGCGRSSKPGIDYTNYLYSQLITSFVKDVIGEKTPVVATNMSASFVIMANHMDSQLFEKLILINPISLKQLNVIPDQMSKYKKIIIQLPFIGTFIYNLLTSSIQISEAFRRKYFAKPQLVPTYLEELYYESAHTGGSGGRFLSSSLIGNYVNNTALHAVKALTTPTIIIGSKEIAHYEHALDDYHKVNQNIDILRIHNANLYPQLEIPEKITTIIEDIL